MFVLAVCVSSLVRRTITLKRLTFQTGARGCTACATGTEALLTSLRACGKRGRWRTALELVEELEQRCGDAAGVTVPPGAWRDALLACRKHKRTEEVAGLVVRMGERADTSACNELLQCARLSGDYRLALSLWRAMCGEAVGGGRGSFAQQVATDVGKTEPPAAADGWAGAVAGAAAASDALRACVQAVAARAAAAPLSVRPDTQSYGHVLALCGARHFQDTSGTLARHL